MQFVPHQQPPGLPRALLHTADTVTVDCFESLLGRRMKTRRLGLMAIRRPPTGVTPPHVDSLDEVGHFQYHVMGSQHPPPPVRRRLASGTAIATPA